MRRWWVVLCVSVGLVGVASAQDRLVLGNQGQYQGVIPGSPNPPPRARVARRARGALVTWPGFEVAPGGGTRIFVQTSRPVTVATSAGPSRLVFRMTDAVISTRNNRNPLVTSQFNTPVVKAYLRRAGRDVELVIDLRADVRPNVTNAPGENGFQFVFIEFPQGDFLPQGQPDLPGRTGLRRRSSVSLSSSGPGSSEETPAGSSMGPTP